MKRRATWRVVTASLTILAVSVPLAACSGGAGNSGSTEITYLTQNDDANTTQAKALIDAFEAENPDIRVKLDMLPSGTEGDNLVKTKLSTGTMAEVFHYNSGSLLQGLNPDTTLVDLSDQPWVADLEDDFKNVVSTDNGLYGAPWATSFAGAVMYNKRVYEDLGLEVPTSWDEFIDNSETIRDAGITPILQSYGDAWTAQLFVLGDFANVTKQDPDWAEKYTNNEAKYVDQPALQGFLNLADVSEKGLLNEDYASMTNAQAMGALATGTAAQYPILTGVIAQVQQNYPDNVDDIGVFALPAQDSADTAITIWQPFGMYIPKSAEGAKLEAAKKFVAFANSPEGCEVQNATSSAAGPYVTSACTLPDDVPAMIGDIQAYFDSGATGSALEFLSPVKGTNLEATSVSVGSGILTPEEGAAQYDADVAKQAQQLGLPGW